MNPQVQSVLTTIIGYMATALATWASTVGAISGSDTASFANIVTSIALWGFAAGVAWYKQRAHSPTAQIAAVNDADNGAKVVAESADAPRITAPIGGK